MSKLAFGPFTIDSRAGELYNDGRRVKVQEKPLRVLEILLERNAMRSLHGPTFNHAVGSFYHQTHSRFLRAELLRTLGRDDEALGWLSTFASDVLAVYELPFEFASYLRRGELHDDRGEIELAVTFYSHFLALWDEADARFQPLVERVEARLRELESS